MRGKVKYNHRQRQYYTYTDHFYQNYEVTFEYELGSCGTYYDPPEPHEINILEVIDEKTNEKVNDPYLLHLIEEEIYDHINTNG